VGEPTPFAEPVAGFAGGPLLPTLPPQRPGIGRRLGLILAAAVVIVAVVAFAVVNIARRDHGSPTANSPSNGLSIRPSQSGTPTPSGGGSSAPGTTPAGLSCPQIRDEQSRLTYQCIDSKLQYEGPDDLLGLRISLSSEVEPGWVLSEGSGSPLSASASPSTGLVRFLDAPVTPAAPAAPAISAEQVAAEVHRRTSRAVGLAYGDNPTSTALSEGIRDFGGVAGFEQSVEVSINPAYAASRGLKVRKERLWVVGLPTSVGVSVFMLSIPDARADLWPTAQATVNTLRVI
jgi:hypothetical protein